MPQNKAFLLIGSERAGKTGTIREWCNLKGYELKKWGLTKFVTQINGKDELIIISSCSPQELEKFNLTNVKELIKTRADRYVKLAMKKGFERFIWIMAITVGVRKDIIKKEEVTEAIKLLTEKGFDLTKIHIRREKDKENENKYEEIDEFIKGINDFEIKTEKEDQKQQAKEFDKIIEKKL